jgi:hypothetical protein
LFRTSDLVVKETSTPKTQTGHGEDMLPFAPGSIPATTCLRLIGVLNLAGEQQLLALIISSKLTLQTQLFIMLSRLSDGLRGYPHKNGKEINIFRPKEHMNRLATGFKHLAFPAFEGDELISCIKSLVSSKMGGFHKKTWTIVSIFEL